MGPLMRKRLRNRSGQALVELLLAFPLLVLMAAAVMAFGRIFHAGLQAEAAAHGAARFAAETLSAGRGVWQAQAAAQLALRAAGLDPGRARVWVQAARWGRGERVRAQVCLRVSVSDIPFARWIVPAGFVDQCATAYREIQRWKSQWEP
ncbi:TadE/TadG family type IV pilus assembly protein [Thermoflexus sp.]|uniref:TadE/TadG family type IV pilus assembly protein n=1 Tax=Thermoflexus sp. TaxID=1969742 RepID=UPI00332E3049